MDANTNPIELCGTVAAVIYQNEENGYAVLKLDVDDGSQTMVVGCIPYAVPGESMIVTGNWMTHPAHGQQFKAEFAERTMPETADAIYLHTVSDPDFLQSFQFLLLFRHPHNNVRTW